MDDQSVPYHNLVLASNTICRIFHYTVDTHFLCSSVNNTYTSGIIDYFFRSQRGGENKEEIWN